MLARRADPAFVMQGGGERAILDWLADTLPKERVPVLVVYENHKVPKLIGREGLPETVVVATTRAVLDFAEQRGLIDSAEGVWNTIISQAEGANPGAEVQIVRPTKRES
jgi:hypothetical protein